MELRLYLALLRRRWLLPVVVVLATLLLTLLTQRPWQPRPITYTLGMSFSVGIRPQTGTETYNYDGYYSALASEYLIDDFSEIVRGSEFAAAVSARLSSQGIAVAPGAIQGSTQTGKQHRILHVTIVGGNPAEVEAIANAVSATLIEDAELFMPRLLADGGAVYLINRGGVGAIGLSLRQRLDLPLRLGLALLTGIGLAFLAEYLDDRIRSREQLEALGITVMGEIPGKPRG